MRYFHAPNLDAASGPPLVASQEKSSCRWPDQSTRVECSAEFRICDNHLTPMLPSTTHNNVEGRVSLDNLLAFASTEASPASKVLAVGLRAARLQQKRRENRWD